MSLLFNSDRDIPLLAACTLPEPMCRTIVKTVRHGNTGTWDMQGEPYLTRTGGAHWTPAGTSLSAFGTANTVISAADRKGLGAWSAGVVEEGAREVVIEPLGLRYAGERLGVR